MKKNLGVMPIQKIRKMIKDENIKNASYSNLQPASLDLSISDEIYRTGCTFTCKTGEPVKEAAKRLAELELYDIEKPLETGVTYLVRLKESLSLPEGIYGYANPKSTSGRNDIHVRLLADGVQRFDSAGIPGYKGDLWVLITPHSFRVRLYKGNTLTQMRFFNYDTRFKREEEIATAYEEYGLLYDANERPIPYSDIRIKDYDGSLILTINLDLDKVGYMCDGSQKVLDFSRNNHNPQDFFQPIFQPKNGKLVLHKNYFYIFSTKEYLRVPPSLAAEMMPVDIRAGEYRSHFAGFIDPGFGFGRYGKIKGLPIVLEMRPFEDNLILEDGRAICKVIFERMAEMPEKVYGETSSHYANQYGPRLSRHFSLCLAKSKRKRNNEI